MKRLFFTTAYPAKLNKRMMPVIYKIKLQWYHNSDVFYERGDVTVYSKFKINNLPNMGF